MSLFDKIQADIKTAMLSKEAAKLSALRMLKAGVMNAEIGKKGQPLTDADVVTVIQKQINQRKESIEQYKKGGREDLAASEQSEIAVLQVYLPAQLDDAKLEGDLRRMLSENSIQSKKDFGKAMQLAKNKFSGQADNKRISDVLNKVLQ